MNKGPKNEVTNHHVHMDQPSYEHLFGFSLYCFMLLIFSQVISVVYQHLVFSVFSSLLFVGICLCFGSTYWKRIIIPEL